MPSINRVEDTPSYTYPTESDTKTTTSSDFDQILKEETIIYANSADDTTFMNPQGIVVQQQPATVISGTAVSPAQLFSSSHTTAPADLEPIFEQASNQYGVRKDLLMAVARAESNFNPSVVSSAGAIGVMQLMPDTAKSLGVNDPYDATQNIMGGARYLANLLSEYNGDISLALAAYNAGSGNVAKYGGIPPFKETQNYVNKILADIGEAAPGNHTAATIYAIASSSPIQAL